jgi:hypothetical protein
MGEEELESQTAPSDRRAVACNYAESTKIAAKGAKAYVLLFNPGNASDRIVVLVRSRGGRWVQKWEDARRLTNPRAVTIPPGHPRYDDDRMLWYDEADQLAESLASRLS